MPASLAGDPIFPLRDNAEYTSKLTPGARPGGKNGATIQQLLQGLTAGTGDAARHCGGCCLTVNVPKLDLYEIPVEIEIVHIRDNVNAVSEVQVSLFSLEMLTSMTISAANAD